MSFGVLITSFMNFKSNKANAWDFRQLKKGFRQQRATLHGPSTPMGKASQGLQIFQRFCIDNDVVPEAPMTSLQWGLFRQMEVFELELLGLLRQGIVEIPCITPHSLEAALPPTPPPPSHGEYGMAAAGGAPNRTNGRARGRAASTQWTAEALVPPPPPPSLALPLLLLLLHGHLVGQGRRSRTGRAN